MRAGTDFIGITTPFYAIDGSGYLALHYRTSACRDEHDRWDTGSGQLEFGLSPEENVLRELEEEYGCSGTIIGSLPAHSIIREQEGRTTHWLAVPFFIRVERSEVVLREEEKHRDLIWATLSSIPTPLHSGFAYTLERYRDGFERYVRR
jgi:8-oxo-dGTP pyrophosphatase MutT (NUDIX family)